MDEPLIYQSKDVLSGTPVFYGTRVPVHTLVDYLSTGETIEMFLEDFPTVTREQVLRFLRTAEQFMVAASHEDSH
jgi:uncharacterized protein (DUF433 family)